MALWHHGGATGGRRFTSSVLKGLTGMSIALSTIRRSRWLSARLPIDDPRWREAVFEPGTDADRKKAPAARSFTADAHDCIMVRIKRSYRVQVCGTKMRPQWRAPLGSLNRPTDSHRPDLKLCKKPVSPFIVAPRAQVSRRSETQAPLSGKPPSFASVSVPCPLSARSGNLIASDGTKNGTPAPNKEPPTSQK